MNGDISIIVGALTQGLIFLGLIINFFQSRSNGAVAAETKKDVGKTHNLVNSRIDEFKAEQIKILEAAVLKATIAAHAAGRFEAEQDAAKAVAKTAEIDKAAAALVDAAQRGFAAGKTEGEQHPLVVAPPSDPVPVALEVVSPQVARDIAEQLAKPKKP